MVDKDQCLIEVVEPMIVWILQMGYEVDVSTLDAYAQHMLSQPVDEKEEIFDTFREKDLSLHQKFFEPTRKGKTKKEVEAVAKKMGLTKEAMERSRDQNILREEDVIKP